MVLPVTVLLVTVSPVTVLPVTPLLVGPDGRMGLYSSTKVRLRLLLSWAQMPIWKHTSKKVNILGGGVSLVGWVDVWELNGCLLPLPGERERLTMRGR